MERTMSFAERVYALCKRIPAGKVSTYGAIANALNSSPRAVGQALRCNPYAPVVPCHRVVKADGNIGGFMGEVKGKEVLRKIALLEEEGVKIKENKISKEQIISFFSSVS
jgi:methylated-DNA-[protein]-cysteine S-methyltransferase